MEAGDRPAAQQPVSLQSEGKSVYPADVGDRLQLRVDEAQQAEQRAALAAETLRDQFARDPGAPRIASDIDRLEGALLDLRRRIAAVHDTAADANPDEPADTDLDRLEESADRMLEEVRQMRDMTGGAGSVSTRRPDEE